MVRILDLAGLTVAFVVAVASVRAQTDPAAGDLAAVDLGRGIAEVNCGACHAVGQDDPSGMETAPAFRDLGTLYPVETLAESLAEGIVTGHEGMPEIELEPEEIEAFLAYLASLRPKP
ncbi:c-type cytochrome [Polymorphum gilvum]|uniref:Putative cytochrome c, class I n=1 Tax=Polymorphum gilvum (strain LMG 25793 / CGMCC 1.9160 / SL003B-26A1) TaxID=991905 RepID=F2J4Z1_POLGS|nr:c-type cytochrome [Polymorphum gilvum]ADZ70033.1 Putative cytochrome c, class I [Polymorphum gilvum SL003B-26A1]